MTGRLPQITAREVVGKLSRAGFQTVRTSGSHCLMVHESDPTRRTTVPLHPGDLPRGLVRAIIRQAGFTVEDFLALP